MKRYLLVLFLLTCFVSAFSQDKAVIEGLEKKLKNTSSVPEKLIILGDLSWNYSFISFDKSLFYGEEELKLAQKSKNDTAIATAYGDIGNAYGRTNKIPEALENYSKALDIRKRLKLKERIAATQSNMGALYKQQGKYSEAISNMTAALKIYEELGDEPRQVLIMGNIAAVYNSYNKGNDARKYLNRGLAMAKRLGLKSQEASCYSGIMDYHFFRKEYDSAIFVAKKGLAIMEETNDFVNYAIITNSIGQCYIELKEYDLAMKNFKESLEIREAMKDPFGIGSCCKNIAFCFLAMNKLDEAVVYIKRSIIEFRKIDSKDYLQEAYFILAESYNRKKDFKRALDNYEIGVAIKDSIFNKQISDKMNELQVQYETEKKEQQISLLNKENEIAKLEVFRRNIVIWIIAGLAIITSVIGYLFYNRHKLRQDKRLQEEIIIQQDLASKGIIEAEERERKRIAGDLHDGVGQMFSAVKMNLSGISDDITFKTDDRKVLFEKTIALVDESCREVRSISHQMMPNILLKSGLASAVRDFIDKIDNNVLKVHLETEGLNERLDNNTETVLYRVIQEAVNNVIKHSKANQLDIQLTKDSEGVAVTIEDNGQGFDTGNKEKFEGIGLKNTATRVEYLKGTVEWDSSPGRGTLVSIFIPVAA